MYLSVPKLFLRSFLACVALSVQPVMAQITDDEPLNLLEGQTRLDNEDNENETGLIPLFNPQNKADPGSDTSVSVETDIETPETLLLTRDGVLLRGLDKITGQSLDMTISSGEQAIFGGLRVTVKACHQTPPTDPPESIAYLEIEDYGFRLQEDQLVSDDINKEKRVFHGWMYASSPGIHALEHPIYDVWVIRCIAAAPDLSDTSSKS